MCLFLVATFLRDRKAAMSTLQVFQENLQTGGERDGLSAAPSPYSQAPNAPPSDAPFEASEFERHEKRHEKSVNDLATNERWLSDNRDKVIHAPPDISPKNLAEEEAHVLRCLGAALTMHWNVLPSEIKRELFDTAGAMGDVLETEGLRNEIARFLHRYKDGDAAFSAPSGGSGR
jgi:hypothetical protein